MRKFLLYSSALMVSGLLSGAAEAACIQTPSCSSLGYTSTTACEGGLKCPWGNYWNCTNSNKITELTNKITNLETQITELPKKVTTSNCSVGDILYSDKTCSSEVISGKTPIGVVFDRANKLAIGLQESREYWTKKGIYLPGLGYIISRDNVTADWLGKYKTRVVLEYCKANGYSCPALEYVNSYKTAGTIAGDWHIPAIGELNAIYGYKDILNTALGKIGGTKLRTDYYWSSSWEDMGFLWVLRFSDGSLERELRDSYMNYDCDYVRPVLAF